MGIRKWEYEATIETKARKQQLQVLMARVDSAIAWATRQDALCLVNIVVDLIPTLVLEECVKAIMQRSMKREEVLLKAFLELYQDMSLRIPTKELNELDIHRRLREVRRCSNKKLRVTRELLEKVRNLKEYAALRKWKSFQYVSVVPGMAYNLFVNVEAIDSFFDFEQAMILNFWLERVRESGTITFEQLQLGVILQERVIEPSVLQLEGQVSFECGSWDVH